MLMIQLDCVYDAETATDDDLANVQFYWSASFIATPLCISPVKDVPIIPTALAKTLAKSHDLVHEDAIKMGYAVYAIV